MSKKKQLGNDIQRAWKKYEIGNFYAARKAARHLLASDNLESSREQAARIVHMTSPDPLALAAGALVFIFSIIIAFVVAY